MHYEQSLQASGSSLPDMPHISLHIPGGLTKIGIKLCNPLTLRRLRSLWFLCSTFDHSVLVGVNLINRRHALVKWCSHEEIYLLTAMPPSMLCFQWSRVWLATIVTNTDLHSSLASHLFPPTESYVQWVGGYVYLCACMWVTVYAPWQGDWEVFNIKAAGYKTC